MCRSERLRRPASEAGAGRGHQASSDCQKIGSSIDGWLSVVGLSWVDEMRRMMSSGSGGLTEGQWSIRSSAKKVMDIRLISFLSHTIWSLTYNLVKWEGQVLAIIIRCAIGDIQRLSLFLRDHCYSHEI